MSQKTESPVPVANDLTQILRNARTNAGESLYEMSTRTPLLLVFLRHTGCPFCREAMADVRKQRGAIEAGGLRGVFVHQGAEDEEARRVFESEGVADVPRVSDPSRVVYRAMGLRRGNVFQMFGPKVWWRAAQAFAGGARAGSVVGDAFQMPGTFVVSKGRVVKAFPAKSQADRPAYAEIASAKDWGQE